MHEMDNDGSGEVDLPEFRKWYMGLSAPLPGGGLSKIELLKLKVRVHYALIRCIMYVCKYV